MRLTKNEICYLSKMNNSFYDDFKTEFSYHSNHMEGSTFTPEALEMLLKHRKVIGEHSYIDILETKNSLDVFDKVIETLGNPLDKYLLWDLHRDLKKGTPDEEIGLSGKWKTYENRLSGLDIKLALPIQVDSLITNLIMDWNEGAKKLADIAEFHCRFELIHPFNDGNGRIGRFIILKQCLEQEIELISVDSEYETQYRESLYQGQKYERYDMLIETFEKCQKRTDEKLSFYNPMIEEVKGKIKP